MRCARPSTTAVLPTPGSPISTGLFFVRRESTCTTRRISSSRPMTGSILPSRARAVRSTAYFSSASKVASGSWLVIRCLRICGSAARSASAPAPACSRTRLAAESTVASAISTCSPEVYSSFISAAMFWESLSAPIADREYAGACTVVPLAAGSLASSAAAAVRTARRVDARGREQRGHQRVALAQQRVQQVHRLELAVALRGGALDRRGDGLLGAGGERRDLHRRRSFSSLRCHCDARPRSDHPTGSPGTTLPELSLFRSTLAGGQFPDSRTNRPRPSLPWIDPSSRPEPPEDTHSRAPPLGRPPGHPSGPPSPRRRSLGCLDRDRTGAAAELGGLRGGRLRRRHRPVVARGRGRRDRGRRLPVATAPPGRARHRGPRGTRQPARRARARRRRPPRSRQRRRGDGRRLGARLRRLRLAPAADHGGPGEALRGRAGRRGVRRGRRHRGRRPGLRRDLEHPGAHRARLTPGLDPRGRPARDGPGAQGPPGGPGGDLGAERRPAGDRGGGARPRTAPPAGVPDVPQPGVGRRTPRADGRGLAGPGDRRRADRGHDPRLGVLLLRLGPDRRHDRLPAAGHRRHDGGGDAAADGGALPHGLGRGRAGEHRRDPAQHHERHDRDRRARHRPARHHRVLQHRRRGGDRLGDRRTWSARRCCPCGPAPTARST